MGTHPRCAGPRGSASLVLNQGQAKTLRIAVGYDGDSAWPESEDVDCSAKCHGNTHPDDGDGPVNTAGDCLRAVAGRF
ncbi:hypothetical protein RXV86_10585 [Alisedimentitalea sp. MJ-SS2]|uniref:hypothetical protein n=1 Tax=Aliisedimentitalea sp. MJ-SS2 TaxID=3049795 RepID=UPI00290877CA|nr:hypothetical protein [Alisedimentitalea sp. MJ-SS2]MDU8927830.1 hypothetical protein [Alisedimentitalea sp. MJ-SS2]